MKDGVLHHPAVLQMLDHDPFEECERDPGVPDALGVDDHDRTLTAHTKAWRFTALHAVRAKEQVLPLEQASEFCVHLSAAAVRAAVPPRAHQHVSGVRIHGRSHVSAPENGQQNLEHDQPDDGQLERFATRRLLFCVEHGVGLADD